VVGILTGLIAAQVAGNPTVIGRLENAGVGLFGAFIGGEFLVAMFSETAPKGFTMFGLVMAIAGAVVGVFLLTLMRKAVGPLRSGKSPSARRH